MPPIALPLARGCDPAALVTGAGEPKPPGAAPNPGVGALGGAILTGGSGFGTVGGAALGGFIGNQVNTGSNHPSKSKK